MGKVAWRQIREYYRGKIGGAADAVEVAYFRADLGLTGDPVSAWAEQGHGQPAAVQAVGAKQPIRSTVGGVPSLLFDGVDDQLVCPAFVGGALAKPFTVLTVLAYVGAGAAAVLSDNDDGGHWVYNGGDNYTYMYNGWQSCWRSPTTPGVIQVLSDRWIGDHGEPAILGHLNGGVPSGPHQGGATYNEVFDGVCFGNDKAEGLPANVHLLECRILKGDVSVAQHNVYGEYFASRYGITWTPVEV